MSDWEITAGRCGACLKFVRDYGSGPKTYGHCGVKPRSGSITPSMYKCDVYVPRPEVAPATPAAPAAARPRPRIDPFEITAATPARRLEPTRPESRVPPSMHTRSRLRDAEPIDLFDSEDAMNRGELRELLKEAIDDLLGIGNAEALDRFKGGKLIVRPGVAGAQDKEIPIDALLHKVVMIRDNLRVLEQKINQHPNLDDTDRVGLQQYITRCYGSLTTFNALFKNREDWFKGSGQD